MGANQDIMLLAQQLVEQRAQENAGQAEEQPAEEKEQVVEDGQSAQEAEEQQDLIELRAIGETHKFSLDQIKELASKGLDYTRKTQELSDRAKIEAEKIVNERTKEVQAERNRLLESCDLLESFYGKPFTTAEQLDQLIQDGDTETYLKLTRQEEKRKEILETAKKERQKIHEAKSAEYQEQLKQQAIQHTQLLFEKMPELREQPNQERLAKFLEKSGLSREEIQNFVDHRGLIIAEKARRYDELSTGKAEPVKQAPPKVIRKVGATVNKQTYVQSDLDAAAQKLAEKGNVRDAASLYLKMRQKGVT